MTRPPLSILIPTVPGREHLLAQTTQAYCDTTPAGTELLTTTGYTYGGGCNALAERAQGPTWLFAPDDAVPHPGWLEAGLAMLAQGALPWARFLTPDGDPYGSLDELPHGEETGWTRVQLLTPALYRRVGALLDLNWWCDVDYGERLAALGWRHQVCDGFAFTHLDGPRLWQSEDVLMREEQAYWQAREARLAPT